MFSRYVFWDCFTDWEYRKNIVYTEEKIQERILSFLEQFHNLLGIVEVFFAVPIKKIIFFTQFLILKYNY